MSHFSRLPSAVRMNAPLRVPTRTRTPLISCSSRSGARIRGARIFSSRRSSLLLTKAGQTGKQDEPFNYFYFAIPRSFSQFPVGLGKSCDFVTGDAEKSAHCQNYDQTARAMRAHHEKLFNVGGAA